MRPVFGTEFGGAAKASSGNAAEVASHPAVAQAAASHPAVAAAIATHPGVQALAPHVAANAAASATAGGYRKPAQLDLNHPAVIAAAAAHPAVAAIIGSHPAHGAAPGKPSAPRGGRGGWDGFGTKHYNPNAHHDTYRGYGDWVRAGRPATWWGRAWSDLWPWHWFGHDVHRRYRDRQGRWIAPPVGIRGWFRSRAWWPWHDIEIVDDPDYVGGDGDAPSDGPVDDASKQAFLTDYADDPAAEAAGYAALESMDKAGPGAIDSSDEMK